MVHLTVNGIRVFEVSFELYAGLGDGVRRRLCAG